MMRVPHPGEGARDRDTDEHVRDNTHDEHGVVVVLVVNEDRDELEDEPSAARECAAGVNAAEVLQRGGATESKL
jgi:hypothetical protein